MSVISKEKTTDILAFRLTKTVEMSAVETQNFASLRWHGLTTGVKANDYSPLLFHIILAVVIEIHAFRPALHLPELVADLVVF